MVQCKSRIKSWDDDVTTWSLKDHVVTLCLRTISVRLKSECIQKLIKHLYFVHLFRLYRENVKKYNFFTNDIRVWHLPFKWLLETAEAKTCKLGQYAYRSCWDISLRDFDQKLMDQAWKQSNLKCHNMITVQIWGDLPHIEYSKDKHTS